MVGRQDVADGSGRSVRDLMTADPAVCTAGSTGREVARMMKECDCGAIPVVEALDDPKPVGIVTDRDLVVWGVAEGIDLEEALVADLMTIEPHCIGIDASIEEAIALMEERKIRRVIVVDADGRCRGMLAQADLARADGAAAEDLLEEVSEPGEERRPTL